MSIDLTKLTSNIKTSYANQSIKINFFSGLIITLYMNINDTIYDVKEYIRKKTNYNFYEINLTFFMNTNNIPTNTLIRKLVENLTVNVILTCIITACEKTIPCRCTNPFHHNEIDPPDNLLSCFLGTRCEICSFYTDYTGMLIPDKLEIKNEIDIINLPKLVPVDLQDTIYGKDWFIFRKTIQNRRFVFIIY